MVVLFFLLLAIGAGARSGVNAFIRWTRQNEWFLAVPMRPEGQVDA